MPKKCSKITTRARRTGRAAYAEIIAMKYVAFFVCSVRITCGEVEPNENRVFRYRRSLVTEINMAEYGDA